MAWRDLFCWFGGINWKKGLSAARFGRGEGWLLIDRRPRNAHELVETRPVRLPQPAVPAAAEPGDADGEAGAPRGDNP